MGRSYFFEIAVGDGYADLDIAELAEHEDEVVGALGTVVTALHATEIASDNLYLFVEGEVGRGERDVIGRDDTIDGSLQSDHIALTDRGQSDMTMGTLTGPVGKEIVDIGTDGGEAVGLLLVETGDKNHAGDDILAYLALGAVGIDMQFFLTGDIALAGLALD